jgi:pimeloyl-ACP methyl ester carboxylesterase
MRAFEILTPPNPDYVQLVHALDVPSLLVIGGTGSVVSPEIAAELAGLNQCLKVVQIAEAGHAIPYDQPDRLSAVIQTCLRSLIA